MAPMHQQFRLVVFRDNVVDVTVLSGLRGKQPMNRDTGSMDSPIWLIGDSSPANWEAELVDPLDSRHPARHNIWTPILESVQFHLYATMRKRLCTDDIYIRNAVHHASEKPSGTALEWSPDLEAETTALAHLLNAHSPKLVLTFGSFAFEFARRSQKESPHPSRYWSTERLGHEFRRRIRAFAPPDIALVPLLHVSIARRHFLKSHKVFTKLEDGNYFDYVAREMAICLGRHRNEFPIH